MVNLYNQSQSVHCRGSRGPAARAKLTKHLFEQASPEVFGGLGQLYRFHLFSVKAVSSQGLAECTCGFRGSQATGALTSVLGFCFQASVPADSSRKSLRGGWTRVGIVNCWGSGRAGPALLGGACRANPSHRKLFVNPIYFDVDRCSNDVWRSHPPHRHHQSKSKSSGSRKS